MEANIINTSNFNQYLNAYFKVYSTKVKNQVIGKQIHNKNFSGLNREKIKNKFKTLRQKVNNKLRKENSVKLESAHINNDQNLSKEIPQIVDVTPKISRGDYMERLRHRYKVSKEKVNHNLLNLQKFYLKRLNERESTKMKKSIVRWSLFTCYIILNYVIYTRNNNLFSFRFLLINSSLFLINNWCIQRMINKEYKEKIKVLGLETLEKKVDH